ncbi:hypothetical protein [uncultured Cohaesibacter sp.]|uniref:hypothetical protein n=1 Tax=uncultured Cohaesibacter sp. TaxID=1002546 RepID=UPI00293073DF|nr:hypothetical protein [uncultured Cohaesibacter sp.]
MTTPLLNLDRFLEDLAYLVNIDSGSKDFEGVGKVADFFKRNLQNLAGIASSARWIRTLRPALSF